MHTFLLASAAMLDFMMVISLWDIPLTLVQEVVFRAYQSVEPFSSPSKPLDLFELALLPHSPCLSIDE